MIKPVYTMARNCKVKPGFTPDTRHFSRLQHFPLGRLPTEAREQIYVYSMVPPRGRPYDLVFVHPPTHPMAYRNGDFQDTLFYANSQIRLEALSAHLRSFDSNIDHSGCVDWWSGFVHTPGVEDSWQVSIKDTVGSLSLLEFDRDSRAWSNLSSTATSASTCPCAFGPSTLRRCGWLASLIG
jgi:hypothetical protein